MAYLKAYLNPTMSFGWKGGGMFSTDKDQLRSGRERRNAGWSQPKRKISAPYQMLSDAAWRDIEEMHEVCMGMLHCFLFHVSRFDKATNDEFGIGDGTQTQFQLARFAQRGGLKFYRDVHALFRPDGTGGATAVVPVITVGGVPTTDFTVDYGTGVVTFNSAPAPGAVLRWSGPYSHWVRFDQDWLPFSFDEPNGTFGDLDLYQADPPQPGEVTA